MRKAQQMNLQIMEENCLYIIEKAGARLETNVTGKHYLLSSGKHSESFFNMARVFERYEWRVFFAHFFMRSMKAQGIDPTRIDVLIGPATGSLPLLYTLQGLPELEKTRVIYAERDHNIPAKFVLGKDFTVADDEQVFILDDVGTTFTSLKAIKALLDTDEVRPPIIGFGVLIDRSPEGSIHALSKAWNFPVIRGMRIPLTYYDDKERCPHCARGVELIKV